MAATSASLDVRLPGGATAPTDARAAVSAYVGSDLDDARLGDLLLLTSEVVTNAVVHAAAGTEHEVRLLLTRAIETVRVAVVDPGPELSPRVRPLAPAVPGGLGLVLVNLLAERWGVERRDARTKEVWFEFLIAPPENGLGGYDARAHLECPACGLSLYTAEAWVMLELCPRCRTGLTRHPPRTFASGLPRAGGQGQGP